MKRKLFLAAALAVIVAWEIFVDFFASYQALRLINIYHLDKVFHLIGGAFIIGLLLLRFERTSLVKLLFLVLAAEFIWELGELLFDPKVKYFLSNAKSLWVGDTIGDVIFTLIGALLYWGLTKKVSAANLDLKGGRPIG